MNKSHSLVVASSIAALGFACSTSSEPATPPETVTYHGALRAVVEESCNGCHAVGGIGPIPLDSYEALKAASTAVIAAVESKRMPPWMPDPACRHYDGERLLTAAQISMFRSWADSGMPEGDPAAHQSLTKKSKSLTELLGPPTVALGPETPYTPNPARPDDYRCFVLDHDFAEETFLRGSNVVPDQADLVHHVILFLVPPQFSEQVDLRDAGDPGVGYTCFGGAGVGTPQPIAGWVPGARDQFTNDDAMIRIPAGAKLVLQMHYNTLAAQTRPDRSQVELWLTTDRPPYVIVPRFYPNLGIQIEAGDAASSHSRIYTNNSGTPWTIVATSPHMHLLGKRLITTKIAANGAEECLVDVPRWDFNWQQAYRFREGEEVTVMPGEKIRLDCTYDNSAANQPVVNGEQQQPRRVTWGEGTLDEMCLNTLIFVEPYAPLPEPGEVCQGFQACYDQCATPSYPLTGCVLRCGAANGCAACVLPGIISCTSDTCGRQTNEFLTCLESCEGSPDQAGCITTQCGLIISAFDTCVRPHIEAGTCDDSYSTCGVEL